jgi:hypothetical protein
MDQSAIHIDNCNDKKMQEYFAVGQFGLAGTSQISETMLSLNIFLVTASVSVHSLVDSLPIIEKRMSVGSLPLLLCAEAEFLDVIGTKV